MSRPTEQLCAKCGRNITTEGICIGCNRWHVECGCNPMEGRRVSTINLSISVDTSPKWFGYSTSQSAETILHAAITGLCEAYGWSVTIVPEVETVEDTTLVNAAKIAYDLMEYGEFYDTSGKLTGQINKLVTREFAMRMLLLAVSNVKTQP